MRKETVVLIDDLSGEESDEVESIPFGLDGVEYEIELGTENANELRDQLAVYIEHARRTGGRARRSTGRSTVRPIRQASSGSGYSREQSRAIREWGRRNGWEVSDRGRLPEGLAQAWEDAHQGKSA